jgi:hypothetical protein
MSYREQYLKRKEYHKQHNKKYREIHGERLNELSKKRNKEAWHDMDDPYFFKRRLSALKGRAKVNKLDFDLDADYLRKILPKDKKCPALNVVMSTGSRDNTPLSERDCWLSLDRIDNKKGYIKGNVHWVSVKANRIMNNGTPEEVMKIALYYQKVKEENINE